MASNGLVANPSKTAFLLLKPKQKESDNLADISLKFISAKHMLISNILKLCLANLWHYGHSIFDIIYFFYMYSLLTCFQFSL